jgi:hypothetical protein
MRACLAEGVTGRVKSPFDATGNRQSPLPCGRQRPDPESDWQKKDKIETEIVGATHAEVGLKVCRKWNLPEEIVEAVGFHHHSAEASSHAKLATIVAMANHCINLLGDGRTVLTPSDFGWLPGDVAIPDQGFLNKLTDDLPEMISSSRQLLQGTTEVIDT